MSGHSYSSPCPNCGDHMDSSSDTKPFDVTSHYCTSCGFHTTVEVGYSDLTELNEQRQNMDLGALVLLPKQEFEKIDRLGERYAYMISRAMKTVGRDSEDIIAYLMEDFYVKDFEKIKSFIVWLCDTHTGYTEENGEGLYWAFNQEQNELSEQPDKS